MKGLRVRVMVAEVAAAVAVGITGVGLEMGLLDLERLFSSLWISKIISTITALTVLGTTTGSLKWYEMLQHIDH